MRWGKHFTACLVIGLGGLACEQEQQPAETPTEPTAAAAPAPAAAPVVPGPAETCTALTAALTANETDKALGLINAGETFADEAVKAAVLAALKPCTCGEAVIDGEKATVKATCGEAEVELPFVKGTDGWKLDAASYVTKYPPKMSKKAKKAALKKAGKKAHKKAKAK
jgi:hypothetical protein